MLTAEMMTGPGHMTESVKLMQQRWFRIDSVLGGTESMRKAGLDLLPQHEKETQAGYKERLSRSVCYNFTDQILQSWVGRVFSEEVELSEGTSAEFLSMSDNIDMLGNNLTVFLRHWFQDGLAHSFSHVLIDYPRTVPNADGTPRTVEDDRNDNIRPYWVHIDPRSVVGSKVDIIDGVERLTQLRLYEVAAIPTDDEFVEGSEHRIRVYDIGQVRIFAWRKDKKGKESWVLIDNYLVDSPGIPLVTFYANRTEPFVGRSPMTDLVECNIEHWQSASDQKAILTVARFPMLALSGGTESKTIEVGPNQWLHCPDPQGRFYYVEHGGKAIEAGRFDLTAIEQRMSNYGAQFLKQRPGSDTATARALDSAEATSPLQDAALRFTDAVNQCLQITADWMGDATAGTVRLELSEMLESNAQPDLIALSSARLSRDISRRQLLTELVRRDVLSDRFSFEENEKELEAEAALLGEITNLDPLADPNTV